MTGKIQLLLDTSDLSKLLSFYKKISTESNSSEKMIKLL